ncbi:hypothetical protein JW935_10185 [candidate division KSB1 bacterium]|nr:hypothetical protein [candidate division KSB1 bacterium]
MSNNEYMTSRERVLSALQFKEPDRVPIDLGGFQTGIHLKAYQALLEYLNLQEDIVVLDPVQQLAKPSEAVLNRLHVDTRYITSRTPDGFDATIKQSVRNNRKWHDLTDEFGVVWSMPDDQQLYMDISFNPLAEATIKDLDSYSFPDGKDPSRFSGVREQATYLRENTPFSIATSIGGVVYEYCWYMRGLEQWFIDMIEQPRFCEVLLDRTLTYWLDYYTGLLSEIGDLVDVVMIGDDLAGQEGPLFSPDFYRRIIKPRQKHLVQRIKSLTTAKVWYHTCGACSVFIPDLIDLGIDILNPVQIGAHGMDPIYLMKTYGEKVVFWGGGIDSQHVLPYVKPIEIRRHVKRNMAVFKPGGGYVFNNVHNIQAGVPAANIVELFDAAYEYGFYDSKR